MSENVHPFNHADLLWYVAKVMPQEQRKAFEDHLSGCSGCQSTVKTMRGWAEEDKEICNRIMGLPFPMLQPELEQSFTDGGALVATPIVERLIQEATQGNEFALPLLRMAAEQAPGLAGMKARTYLQTIATEKRK